MTYNQEKQHKNPQRPKKVSHDENPPNVFIKPDPPGARMVKVSAKNYRMALPGETDQDVIERHYSKPLSF